jgi:hypothetical protein
MPVVNFRRIVARLGVRVHFGGLCLAEHAIGLGDLYRIAVDDK